MRQLVLAFILIIYAHLLAKTQINYTTNYFSSPVDFPIVLAGNFGEIRSGHFHAGLDIKTQQVEGKNIYASAAGYISRIKISLGGYGKVLYVTHPNGYTTVYAHLQKFNNNIENYVRKRQYQAQSFCIEIFPDKHELPVNKGEVIALSGNTGGSGGPHLHFEIRDSQTETPINPLLFGFDIEDTKAPVLNTLGVYPLNDVSAVNGKNEALYVPLVKNGTGYTLVNNPTIEVSGKIGFGIEATDYLNAAPNHCGVYSIELLKNGVSVYKHEMEKIPFHESRFINAHVDYLSWKKNKKPIQHSFMLPNNKLSIYKHLNNKGQLFFLTDTTYQMEYFVTDAYKNISTLKFLVHSKKANYSFVKPKEDSLIFRHNEVNYFENNSVSVYFPKGVLYDDIIFNYKEIENPKYLNNKIYEIANYYTPIQNYVTISIKVDSNLLPVINKIVGVSITPDYKFLANEGGVSKGNCVDFKTRSLGLYALMIDTVNPIITPVNISLNKAMQNEKFIKFKLTDNISGIETYNGYINNKWELFEFDKKTGELFFEFDQTYNQNKKHLLKIVITDERGNESVYETSFFR